MWAWAAHQSCGLLQNSAQERPNVPLWGPGKRARKAARKVRQAPDLSFRSAGRLAARRGRALWLTGELVSWRAGKLASWRARQLAGKLAALPRSPHTVQLGHTHALKLMQRRKGEQADTRRAQAPRLHTPFGTILICKVRARRTGRRTRTGPLRRQFGPVGTSGELGPGFVALARDQNNWPMRPADGG